MDMAGHISRRWNAALTVSTPRGNENGGEMNYNSTVAMWSGTWNKQTKTFADNVLRFSFCSGLTMVEDAELSVLCWEINDLKNLYFVHHCLLSCNKRIVIISGWSHYQGPKSGLYINGVLNFIWHHQLFQLVTCTKMTA